MTLNPDIRATYRVQLTPHFDLDALTAVVPYLARLGISHVYCSSYLQAGRGSEHGYDVVDHTSVNDEIGGEDALERLTDALDGHGMGHILDVIPNHMAIGSRASKWWWDVLKNGPDSSYAASSTSIGIRPIKDSPERSLFRYWATTTDGCSRPESLSWSTPMVN